MSHREAHPAALRFPLLAGDEYRQLREDIRQHGLREPIVLDARGRVLDGRNRLRACVDIGVEPVFRTEALDPIAAYEFVWSENVLRRHLAPGQRAALQVDFDADLAALRAAAPVQANERRSQAMRGNQNARKAKQRVPMLAPSVPKAESSPGSAKTRDRIARAAGVAAGTAQKALAVHSDNPELHRAVCDGKVTLNAAYQKVQKAAALRKIATLGPANPGGTYGLWRSDVTRARLQAIAMAHEAVISAAVEYPDADIQSTEKPFPSLTVTLLTPGQVVVQ